jgi:hypothetical protein
VTDESTLGIVIRSDFTDDTAWTNFLSRLRDEEAALARPSSAEAEDDVPMDEGEESSESEDEDEAQRIFTVLDPTDAGMRSRLSGISNLGVLRLFCDPNIAPAPVRPQDVRPVPQHRLIDSGGWQEVYVGKDLWVYDKRSNRDQSVRVISSRSNLYGTATYVNSTYFALSCRKG